MSSTEIVLCTEEKIVCFFVFEHCIDRGNGGYADGSWGQASVSVGVVGTVGVEHIAFDAADGEVADGEFDSWVGLEWHAYAEAVEINGGYVGFFFLGIGFFFHNGGNGEYLLAG